MYFIITEINTATLSGLVLSIRGSEIQNKVTSINCVGPSSKYASVIFIQILNVSDPISTRERAKNIVKLMVVC